MKISAPTTKIIIGIILILVVGFLLSVIYDKNKSPVPAQENTSVSDPNQASARTQIEQLAKFKDWDTASSARIEKNQAPVNILKLLPSAPDQEILKVEYSDHSSGFQIRYTSWQNLSDSYFGLLRTFQASYEHVSSAHSDIFGLLEFKNTDYEIQIILESESRNENAKGEVRVKEGMSD
jgi:hypothetical protein